MLVFLGCACATNSHLKTMTLALVLLWSPFSYSVPSFFHDESNFVMTLGASHTLNFNDFESIGAFGQRVGGGRTSFGFDGVQISAQLPAIKVMSRAYSGNHNVTPGGSKYLSFDTDIRSRGAVFTLRFDIPVDAFGFYIIDHDASDASINWQDKASIIEEVSDAESEFWGVRFDTPQYELTINSIRDSQISLDEMYFGYQRSVASVPEPYSLGLLMVGLFGVMMAVRRSR